MCVWWRWYDILFIIFFLVCLSINGKLFQSSSFISDLSVTLSPLFILLINIFMNIVWSAVLLGNHDIFFLFQYILLWLLLLNQNTTIVYFFSPPFHIHSNIHFLSFTHRAAAAEKGKPWIYSLLIKKQSKTTWLLENINVSTNIYHLTISLS